jgi:glycosyltransferase involved in cell wall biosynthesis
MKITYASFDEVPSFKAASTHILANCRLAMRQHDLLLLSLGEVALPPVAGFSHAPAAIRERNYLRRGEAFRSYVHRHLLASRPDVFHFRTPWEGLLASRLKLANVYEVNGLPSIELPYHYRNASPQVLAVLRSWEQACLEQADAIVCPSGRIKHCLLNRYAIPDPTRITVIPNGYDPVDWHPAQAVTLPLKAVYLGTLSAWQGHIVGDQRLFAVAWAVHFGHLRHGNPQSGPLCGKAHHSPWIGGSCAASWSSAPG